MELLDYVNEANWPTDLEDAREFARDAVTNWKWKEKAPDILTHLDRATNIKRIQQLVIYPILSGEGLSVLK